MSLTLNESHIIIINDYKYTQRLRILDSFFFFFALHHRYSSDRHGFGMENLEQRWDKQFSRKSKKSPLCVILIRTSKGKILGAFTSGHLREKVFLGRSNLMTRHFTLFGYDEKLKDLSVYRSMCGPLDEGDEGLYVVFIYIL